MRGKVFGKISAKSKKKTNSWTSKVLFSFAKLEVMITAEKIKVPLKMLSIKTQPLIILSSTSSVPLATLTLKTALISIKW